MTVETGAAKLAAIWTLSKTDIRHPEWKSRDPDALLSNAQPLQVSLERMKPRFWSAVGSGVPHRFLF